MSRPCIISVISNFYGLIGEEMILLKKVNVSFRITCEGYVSKELLNTFVVIVYLMNNYGVHSSGIFS